MKSAYQAYVQAKQQQEKRRIDNLFWSTKNKEIQDKINLGIMLSDLEDEIEKAVIFGSTWIHVKRDYYHMPNLRKILESLGYTIIMKEAYSQEHGDYYLYELHWDIEGK